MSVRREGFALDQIQTAEDEGFEAFVQGYRESGNPFSSDDMHRQNSWRAGWNEARLYVNGMRRIPE